jgi:hypothetical protein
VTGALPGARRTVIALVAFTLGVTAPRALAQDVRVVNMIPVTLSNETNQDSEPDLTIDPNDRDIIIATAFTPNPSGATTTAPVFVSQDGGATWVLANIVPSGNGSTGDITVTCSRNNVLYAGILRGGNNLDMRILRGSPCTSTATMIQLMGRTQEDQPYARSVTPTSGAQANNDILIVGHNDFNNSPRTASVEQSVNAATAPAPAGLAVVRLERRNPSGQDGPPIRPAIHPDGTVYAAYTQRTASAGAVRTGNIVVVRDDDFGQGANAYSDLIDPGDSLAGRIVVAGVSWIFNNNSVFGQERLGDRVSIAVDPRDSQTVYVAWVDNNGVAGNTSSIHVRRSTDGGANWSADLLTVTSALNPQLAVNGSGDVAVLYQELTGAGTAQRWRTHFRQSANGGTTWTDVLLATHPANTPAMTFLPYLGDYVGLTAVGDDFYGVFSASNVPDMANFPSGVTYQRTADFATQTLLDAAKNPVAASIDPFFFQVLAPRPQIQIPGSVSFGDACVSTTAKTGVLNVCNTGKADLVVESITSSDPVFAVATPSAGFPVTISPDFCFPFQVTFTASSPGPKSATLTVASNDPDVPSAQATATATVGQPIAVTMIADTGNFGELCPNPATFRDLPLTINNAGSCPLTVTGIASSSPEFQTAQVLTFPLVVAPGASVDVPIRFQPTSAGAKAANITIATNDPASPAKVVAVSGTAPEPYVCEAPLFAAIDAAIGPTWGSGRTGKYTFNGSGRVMAPFGPSHTFGVQAQGEYMFYPGRQEGQLDTGLLYRRDKLQFGFSGSFKAANLRDEASPGALSHATLGVDVLLPNVRFGLFGSKGLKETDVVTLSESLGAPPGVGQPIVATEQLLHTIDQFGGAVQFEVAPDMWIDGHLEYLNRHAPGMGDTAGAAVRFTALVLTNVAVTAQFDVNESFVGPNTTGTFTFGVTLGRWSRPSDYSNPLTPLGTYIPRVHYERYGRVR